MEIKKILESEVMLRIVLLSLYITLVMVMSCYRTVPLTGYETDGVCYMIRADILFTDRFIPPTYGGGMGMPFAIRFMKFIADDTFSAAKLVSALAGCLYLAASFGLMTRLFSPLTGFWGTLLLLVNPTVLIFSTTSLSDMLAASLAVTAVWMLTGTTNIWSFLISGLLLGLGWTTRSVTVAFFPVILLPLLERDQMKSDSFRRIAAGAAGIVLGCLPQMVVNTAYFANPVHSDNWKNIAMMLYGMNFSAKVHSLGDMLRHDWLRLCLVWIKRFIVQVPTKMYEAAYLPVLLALPGLMIGQQAARKRSVFVLWGGSVLFYLFLVAPVWSIELRYFLPVLPFVMISAVVMWQKTAAQNRRFFAAGIISMALMSAFASFENITELVKNQAPEFTEAGRFLKETAEASDTVLSSQPHISYYAGRDGLLFENLSPAELENLGATVWDRRIRWVVFDERQGLVKFEALKYLLNSDSPYGWRLAFVGRDYPRIFLWETYSNYPQL